MRDDLWCIECFVSEGKHKSASFMINGQSMCQKHLPLAVRNRGEGIRSYTWPGDLDVPVIEPEHWAGNEDPG